MHLNYFLHVHLHYISVYLHCIFALITLLVSFGAAKIAVSVYCAPIYSYEAADALANETYFGPPL